MTTPPLDIEALLERTAGHPTDLLSQHVNPSFAKVLRTLGFDIDYVRGEGAYLWDRDGTRYIDCLAGFGVFGVGRNHPVIREAITRYMAMDLPNLPKFGAQKFAGVLAERLIELAPAPTPGSNKLDTVYFCNSGAEGCETAIKYARAATGRPRVIYCKKGYHGLTLGALSCNGGVEFREGFGDLLPWAEAVPFNDLDALKHELAKGDVAGFLVEPIQGKGVNVPSDDYLPRAAELCRQHGAVFIADEVQTGFGRTGKMFACEHWGVEPDIMVTSKALSGGFVPVGAVLSKRWIHSKVFSSMDRCMVHSTTFGQNDMAMIAGLATLHVLEQEKIVENSATVGGYLMQRLAALKDKYELIKDVRGKGLMIALEFGPPRSLKLKMGWSLLHKVDASLFPQAVLIPLMQDHKILAQTAGHHQDTIKLLPPLVLSKQDADEIVEAFDATIDALHHFPGAAWEIGKRLTRTALT
ncbi:MAG: aspartate aminotransferase family protein [Phycisphaeraceae bacterium]|nr:aspartate aminotransferase family protein [Phycisphaeraceae bacterium]